ncbi:hypothetical protein ACLHDF_25110 [Priestia aryabhattai]|uniref:hypothetical protein n=1 Tax=Priestia megaterium TaxID=1404 RepID=UPI0039B84407
MVKINVKKHLLICTCILGLSTAGVLIQSTIHSSSTESNLALNKAVELHITAEQQKQAELNSIGENLLKNSENLQPENKDVEIHVTAEEQQKIEQIGS